MLRRRTPGKERVIRTLLNHPDGTLTKYKVAKASECPWASTHRILKGLEKAGLIRDTRVLRFKDLVMVWNGWKAGYDVREYLVREPLKVFRRATASGGLQYALTTYQAENLVQNYLFPSRIDFYIEPEEKQKWHSMLVKEEEALVGKGNVRLVVAHDKHVFYNSQIIEGLRIVSIPQLIVDLFREGGVCVEAADNLLEKVATENLV